MTKYKCKHCGKVFQRPSNHYCNGVMRTADLQFDEIDDIDNPITPKHYRQYDVEVIEMMRRIWGDNAVSIFCVLNAFKYRMRAGHKDDTEQDLQKEAFYLDYANRLKDVNNDAAK